MHLMALLTEGKVGIKWTKDDIDVTKKMIPARDERPGT